MVIDQSKILSISKETDIKRLRQLATDYKENSQFYFEKSNSLEIRLNEALAKLAEATKDKERLDWLSSKPHYEEFVKRIPAIAFWHLQLRTAIDAAMKRDK